MMTYVFVPYIFTERDMMRCHFLQQLTSFYKPNIMAAFTSNPNVTKTQYFPTMEFQLGPPWSSCSGRWRNRQWFSPQGCPLSEIESDSTFGHCSPYHAAAVNNVSHWPDTNTTLPNHCTTLPVFHNVRFVMNAALLRRGLFIWSQCYCIYTWELLKGRHQHTPSKPSVSCETCFEAVVKAGILAETIKCTKV